jgi:putative ABC transport system permease protein
MMIAKVQTNLLKNKDVQGRLIETSEDSAEKIAIQTLVMKNGDFSEDVTTYGISDESKYVKLPKLGDREICISQSYAEKYGLKPGDTVKLEEKYRNHIFKLKVKEVTDYEGSLAVFMKDSAFNKMFDLEDGYYNAFFSQKKLTDIEKQYVANVITKKDITRMADQLDHSMGGYMLYFQYLCMILAAVLMFLLTKLIIERNAQSISMTKILGYTTSEISRVYLIPTTWAVVISAVVSVVISKLLMTFVWIQMFQDISGYFAFVLDAKGMFRMGAYILLAYGLVTVLDFGRIRKIPLAEALKNAE